MMMVLMVVAVIFDADNDVGGGDGDGGVGCGRVDGAAGNDAIMMIAAKHLITRRRKAHIKVDAGVTRARRWHRGPSRVNKCRSIGGSLHSASDHHL